MPETYVVHVRTDRSCMSVGTEGAANALERARHLAGGTARITISDRDVNEHTIEELEESVRSGAYARPESASDPVSRSATV